MIITEYNNFSGRSYRIIIKQNEDIDAFDIAESFKKQYPKEKAIIICSSEQATVIRIGLLIVGLKLK